MFMWIFVNFRKQIGGAGWLSGGGGVSCTGRAACVRLRKSKLNYLAERFHYMDYTYTYPYTYLLYMYTS